MTLQVLQPQKQESALDKVAKLLQIGQAIHGISSDSSKLEMMKAQQEQELAYKAGADKRAQDELAMKQKEHEQAQSDRTAAMDPNSPISRAYRQRLRDAGIRVDDSESAYSLAQANMKPGDLTKERVQGEEARKTVNAKAYADQGITLPGQSREDVRVAKLGAQEKARYDNVLMANQAINEMYDALKAGGSRYSPIGDNDYTVALRRFEEAMGRMQSGGAISKDEENRFRTMARSLGDDPDMQVKKLEGLKAEMTRRYKTLGFDPANNPIVAKTVSLEDSRKWPGANVNEESVPDALSAPPKTKFNAEDLEALQWAKENPKDKRSRAILMRLKQKGL